MLELCELLVCVFLFLDWDSLLQARRVCKRWNSVIRSTEFRSQWRNKQEGSSVVLLTAYNAHWSKHPRPEEIRVWSPGSAELHPVSLPTWMKIPLLPATFDIVASSHGLVLARHPSWSDDQTPGVEFTVGNPATNEWVRIPRLKHQKSLGRLYSMAVDPVTGHFRILDTNNSSEFDSTSRSWARILVPFPEGTELLDHTRGSLVQLREPLVSESLGCCPAVWEHGGRRYIAQASESREDDVCYKVWSMEMGGGDECVKIAKSTVDFNKFDVFVSFSLVVECQAEDNLVCFAGQCRDWYDDEYAHDLGGQPLHCVVYDLDVGKWIEVPSKAGEEVHYRRAVVYRPSLVRPAGSTSSRFEDDGNKFEWHKRKREEQPEMCSVRQKRMKIVNSNEEIWEDIFFL